MIRLRPVLYLIVGALATSGAAAGAEYADPSGFTLTYPDDWVLLRPAEFKTLIQAGPPDVRDWLAKNKLDPATIAVALFHPDRDFADNVIVTVHDKQVPLTDQALGQATDLFVARSTEAGMTVENLRGRVERVGAREAIVIDLQSRMLNDPELLWQREILIPGGGKTYSIAFTTTADRAKRLQPAFDAILATFQTPQPSRSKGDLGDFAALVVSCAFGAMFVGAALRGVARLFGGSRPEMES